MKRLFELVTTQLGESYVRCYVWCDSEAEAMAWFAEKYPGVTLHLAGVSELFNAQSDAFITRLSDNGFER